MFRQLELTKENKRLLIKFAVSLLVTVLLTVMLCTLFRVCGAGDG